MSTQRIRLKDRLDQENEFRTASKKGENATIPTKRPSLGAASQEKRTRIPLGGKDQNMVSLQRSKLFIPQNAPVRGVPALAKKPELSKSNSTLGFTHTKLSFNNAPQFRNTNPHKNSIFPSTEAHRTNELVPRFSSDSMKKQPRAELPKLGAELLDTMSAHTRLTAPELNERVTDPVKKGYDNLDAIIEILAADENSVATVPEKVTPLADEPIGVSTLTEEDLAFLRAGVGRHTQKAFTSALDVSFDLTFDSDEELESNARLQDELEQSGGVGLTTEELNDLLDF